MLTFESAGPIRADINVEYGSVRVIAGDRKTTVVDVRPADDKRKADVEAAEKTRVDFVDGRLELRAARPRHLGLFGRPGLIEVVVQLPAGSDIRGLVSYGDFDVDGRVGDCAIKTSYGNVRVGEAEAVDVHTSYGDINVGRAAGAAEISLSWGTIRVGEAHAATNIKSAGGDIVIEKTRGDIQARTSYGEVRVAKAAGGSLNLATSFGAVRVGVAEGTPTRLDLLTETGKVRNELEESDGQPKTKDTLTVRAQTKFGDITISRA
jgi:hypothetical protein